MGVCWDFVNQWRNLDYQRIIILRKLEGKKFAPAYANLFMANWEGSPLKMQKEQSCSSPNSVCPGNKHHTDLRK